MMDCQDPTPLHSDVPSIPADVDSYTSATQARGRMDLARIQSLRSHSLSETSSERNRRQGGVPLGHFWTNTFKIGAKNLLLHKLRSVLTILGVVLGVGSVIAMLAIGEGSKQKALEQIRQLGASNIIIRSVKPGQKGDSGQDTSAASQQQITYILEYGLKYKDFERLLATLPTVERGLPIALVRKTAQYEHRFIPNARILGTTPECLAVKNLRIRRGRFLTTPDSKTMANVAVLGDGAAERLFSYQDPLGKSIYLEDDAYRVIGVLERHDSGNAIPGAIGQQNFNNEIYIPLSAARSRIGELQMTRSSGSRSYERTQLGEITLMVKNIDLVVQTAEMARAVLRRQHPKEDDFEILIPLEKLQQAESEKRIWNLVLGSIAGISLLVGGIGIMNIMLASVTERTREIGVRRALGAKRRDITIQFLIETVVLSSTGGVIGILLGISLPLIVSHFFDIETITSWWSILLAFGISVGIGVTFGLYPARKAALMDPIEALRHE